MRTVFIQIGLGAGGAEKIIAMLARHRAELGDEVHVIAMNCPADGPYFKYPDNVTLHVMDKETPKRVRFLQLRRLLFIRRTLKELQPDVVISFLTKINVLTLLGNFWRKFPIIASERNNPKAQKNNGLWRHLNNLTSVTADLVVMLTHKALGELPDSVRRKAIVINNPCGEFPGISFQPKGLKRVVSAGRLDHQKGFDHLITAFDIVRKAHPDATLTIFGEGKERAPLQKLINKLGLNDVVTMPGTTKRNGSWIEKGDIFVLSSRHEGFANVVAEATVAGIPTVSVDCDYGPREIIRSMENGVLVPLGSTDALANALVLLLNDPDLQKKFTAAAQINRERFMPEKILSQWDNAIDTVMAARSEKD
ncbi:glycosyltransferase family 4 protein [Actibacterium lipolyticum]|uniref:GalNAc-alpha-(1->4)-GalNAc-alpha-(1->3)-diNAcBac-PP-undecaprenol alpha-1,4-N-acetyl-D-galactosaminyltransferase n=1 Tax=Actibacterium lipolyticum TaxID=1524263 RepID=A0A238KWN4_9RHOB|nr:glycosyltransferase family 4 protein [Actibacterium lipolyticum]SMX47254.1 GalNAc-alpha-(1->4)-GalNAc-alpha-(1->3)-diNAcBac-PP-undecaprenol alpha-1,4-N-acetyl-D-galactosaminyltransferase [Actibacterium lipolyticum]